jgi:hypothetical protein
MSTDLHDCMRGPVCQDEFDMGLNSDGQRVVVVEYCGHDSCKRIRDSAAGCDECMDAAIAEDMLIDEIEEELGK